LGIVLVYDEVISFRVAHGGAQAKYGGAPDLTAFGKIMGGGLPVGAVGGRDAIMGLLDPRRGAPVVALRTQATEAFADAGVPGQLTGDGSLFRILLTATPVTDYRGSLAAALPAAQMLRLHRHLLDEGVIVSHTGLGALSTPMSEAEVDRFVEALRRALKRLREEA
jgi:glutamate-1-semialdehyde 2,1-aminomutase